MYICYITSAIIIIVPYLALNAYGGNRVLQLPIRKICQPKGEQIYFDANDVNGRTESGKWVPLSKDTRAPHQCQ
jgi:hypothetical protein